MDYILDILYQFGYYVKNRNFPETHKHPQCNYYIFLSSMQRKKKRKRRIFQYIN